MNRIKSYSGKRTRLQDCDTDLKFGEEKNINKPAIAESRNLKLQQKRSCFKDTDTFSDLQPQIEIPYSEIVSEIKSEAYKDPLWKKWLQAAKQFLSSHNGNLGKQITEILHLGSHLVGVTHLGICFSYDQYSRKIRILNKNAEERVRSIFYNQSNQNIFIVSVHINLSQDRRSSSMTCRSLPIEILKAGQKEGVQVFQDFILKYPDFIEFDDLNKRIVTMHSDQSTLRIWDIETYKLLFVLQNDKLQEFKICNGVILLILEREAGGIPFQIHNVYNGSLLHKIAFQTDEANIEFLEQFNQKMLVKQEGKNILKVIDLITEESYEIKGFQTPQAFIFIYERNMMLGLNDGRFLLHNVKTGKQISDFNNEKVYSITPTLSDDRKLLFAVVQDFEQKQLVNENSSFINVIDIKNGIIKSRINCHGRMDKSSKLVTRVKSSLETKLGKKKYATLMNQIKCLHYGIENMCHQFVTGHLNGSIVIWK